MADRASSPIAGMAAAGRRWLLRYVAFLARRLTDGADDSAQAALLSPEVFRSRAVVLRSAARLADELADGLEALSCSGEMLADGIEASRCARCGARGGFLAVGLTHRVAMRLGRRDPREAPGV